MCTYLHKQKREKSLPIRNKRSCPTVPGVQSTMYFVLCTMYYICTLVMSVRVTSLKQLSVAEFSGE